MTKLLSPDKRKELLSKKISGHFRNRRLQIGMALTLVLILAVMLVTQSGADSYAVCCLS
jgi:hypothetical protein